MKNLFVAHAVGFLAIVCLVLASDGLRGAEVKGVKQKTYTLNEVETKFVTHLAGRGEQFKQMVGLLGLAQAASLPKTPAQLASALALNGVTSKLPDIADTVRNLQIIHAVKAREEVMLFRMEKHPDFPKQKPSRENYQYFRNLEDQFTKVINAPKKATKK